MPTPLPVSLDSFTGDALARATELGDLIRLGIFALVIVGGFLTLTLAWVAVQGLRR